MTIIKTQRLLLRGAIAKDVYRIHEIMSNEAAMQYWSTPPHKNLKQTQKWLDEMINISPESGEDFIIELEGKVIGKAGLYS